jgi:hypothetical protein
MFTQLSPNLINYNKNEGSLYNVFDKPKKRFEFFIDYLLKASFEIENIKYS